MIEEARKLAAEPNLVVILLLLGIAGLTTALVWVVRVWRGDVKEMLSTYKESQALWKASMDGIAEANDKVADALNAINVSVARIQGAVSGRS